MSSDRPGPPGAGPGERPPSAPEYPEAARGGGVGFPPRGGGDVGGDAEAGQFPDVQRPVETNFPYPVSDVYDPETLAADRGPVHTYLYSGTRELEGVVNWWLYAVIVGLVAWGIFYTLYYWGGPGPGLDYSVPV
jgi:hypothetical protein